jgi:hypothetical protein
MYTLFVIRPQVVDEDAGEEKVRLVRLAGEAYVHGMIDDQYRMIANAQPQVFAVV